MTGIRTAWRLRREYNALQVRTVGRGTFNAVIGNVMKTKVQKAIRTPDGAIGAIGASAIAIHVPQHNDERVPVPILSTTRLLLSRDYSDSRSRPAGEMIQTDHSRRQSVAEGDRAAALPTSSQMELWSLFLARANFEELLLNYENMLRQQRLPQWTMDSAEALAVRGFLEGLSDPTSLEDHAWEGPCAHWLDHSDPAVRVNASICLIHRTNYLLDQQIAVLEKAFVKERR